MSNIYLDNNATTQPLSAVCERVAEVSSQYFGNPSSIHSTGYAAECIVSSARKTISAAMHAEESQLVFTSGATESNNTVFDNTLKSGGKLITTVVEHSSVLTPAKQYESQGGQVAWLPVGGDGVINLDDLQDALDETVDLVSIQWANSETGVIQPIAEVATMCRQFETHFHSDAVQAFGKIPVDLRDVPLDSMSISAHKLHGPKGVGGLFLRNPDTPLASITGGDQEFGHRAGTENVAGIAGFETAVSERFDSFEAVASSLEKNLELLESLILGSLPCAVINSSGPGIVNTLNVQFEGIDGQALVVILDQLGVQCSQSSACTNSRPEPSYVLRAMGLSEEQAYSSVRFSISQFTTAAEIETAVATITKAVQMQQNAFHSEGVVFN